MSINKTTQQMEIKYRPLHAIIPLPGNTRVHDLEGIMGSISEFGFIDPILVSSGSGYDLDGNPAPGNILIKMETSETSGTKKVPVWYAPTIDAVFDAETEPIVALRLNRAHAKGGYDEAKVFSVLEQARAFDRLEQTGYDDRLFEMLALRHAPAPEFEVSAYGAEAPVALPSGGLISQPAVSPGAHPTTGNAATPNPVAPTLGASHVRMVQLFLNADTHPVFYERTQALTASKRYCGDNDLPVNNLTDLLFCLVRDAYHAYRAENPAVDQDDD
jgi:hypothetical protein